MVHLQLLIRVLHVLRCLSCIEYVVLQHCDVVVDTLDLAPELFCVLLNIHPSRVLLVVQR